MKTKIILFLPIAVTMTSCNMGVYYANKRIAHSEDFSFQETRVVTGTEDIKTFPGETVEPLPGIEGKTVSLGVSTETAEVQQPLRTFHPLKKEETQPVKTEMFSKKPSTHQVKKEKQQQCFSSNGDSDTGTWIFVGSIVAIAAAVGLLTHSILIGLLTAVGIPVLLFLVLCIIFFCFGGFYLGD